jgi:hypothetical protein
MMFLFALWDAQGWATLVAAVSALVVALVGAVKGWYLQRSERKIAEDTESLQQRHSDDKLVFEQQRTIIADLRKRVASLEERQDELVHANVRLEQSGIVSRERIDYLERKLAKVEVLYMSCTVANCPIIASLKATKSSSSE